MNAIREGEICCIEPHRTCGVAYIEGNEGFVRGKIKRIDKEFARKWQVAQVKRRNTARQMAGVQRETAEIF